MGIYLRGPQFSLHHREILPRSNMRAPPMQKHMQSYSHTANHHSIDPKANMLCDPVRYKFPVPSSQFQSASFRSTSTVLSLRTLGTVSSAHILQTASSTLILSLDSSILQAGATIFSPLKDLPQADQYDENHNPQDVSNFRIQLCHIIPHILPWPPPTS